MNTMTAVEVIVLEGFPDSELAAFTLAIHFPGYIPKHDLSYKRAFEAKLIQETGRAWDVQSLQRAATFEVNRRVDAGTWGMTGCISTPGSG